LTAYLGEEADLRARGRMPGGRQPAADGDRGL